MKFGQLIVGMTINITATGCHILRRKCAKFDSWRLYVCLFVRLSVCVFDRVWHWGLQERL